jgi:hypothetical protein
LLEKATTQLNSGTSFDDIKFMKKEDNVIASEDLKSIIEQAIAKHQNELPNVIRANILTFLKKKGYLFVSNYGSIRPITSEGIRKRMDRIYEVKRQTKDKPVPEKEIEPISWEKDLQKKTEKQEENILKKKYDSLLQEYEKLQRVSGVTKEFFKPLQDWKIPVKGNQRDKSIAVVLASDWHYEEEVRPETVNHLNSFDLKIADDRITNFFNNIVKLIKKEQKDSEINTLVLALLGDFITGNIHDDNVESSQLGVGAALWTVQSRINSGIRFLLDNTNLDLVIPCHSGNHARHTKKQRIANENDNSLEWLMYKNLAMLWGGNKRVMFLVGDSYHSYVEVFPGYTIRFHHGHHVRYGGGIGGLTIPINKAISQWNKNRNVQLDCLGHFHQFHDGGNFVVNCSLIGFSPYAISVKGAYERPTQTFFLINGKYLEKTCTTKIFLE